MQSNEIAVSHYDSPTMISQQRQTRGKGVTRVNLIDFQAAETSPLLYS